MKTDLNIPTLDEITIGQYQAIEYSYSINGDSPLNDWTIISTIYGISIDEVKTFKNTTIRQVVNAIKEVLNSEAEFKHRFTLNGVEYGFIPNMDELSGGEYGDLEGHLKEIKTYHKAMAVMFRPITETYKDKYQIEEYKGTSKTGEIMKQAPLSVLMGAIVFFCDLERELLQASLTFIEKQTKEMSRTFQPKDNTQKNGDGMLSLTELLEVILKESKQQQEEIFTRFSQN